MIFFLFQVIRGWEVSIADFGSRGQGSIPQLGQLFLTLRNLFLFCVSKRLVIKILQNDYYYLNASVENIPYYLMTPLLTLYYMVQYGGFIRQHL